MANWAIVIGIDKYWKPQACLRGAVRDALKIYDWLTNINGGGVPTNNLTLLLEPSETSPQPPAGKQILSPTQDGVFAAIQHLLSRSYKQGGRFYFYYSGHGIAAWMNQSNQDGITFSDFSEANPLKSVTLDSIYDLFKATHFQEQFFFIDACRNIPWEREFRISDYPFPEKPIPPVPPQYIIYATSPGVKAIEINKAGDEHGAFTEVLLDGLRGKGKSKVWDDNAQEYVVHWDNLVKYVGDEVEKKRLKVDDGLIQEPREYGDHKGSPEFGRFPEGSFPKETLDVNLDPLDIPPKTEVVVGDLGGVVQSKSPVNELPVRFSLDPGKYSVRAAALSYRSERKYYPVDLYTPETVLVKLIPGDISTDKTFPTPTDITKGIGYKPTTGNLEILSNDPTAQIELTDDSGRVILSGFGRQLLYAGLSPGFYRARLRSPEGKIITDQLIEFSPKKPDEKEIIILNVSKLPDSGLLNEVIKKSGIHTGPDNSIYPSEALGALASPRISTILALAGGVMNEVTPYGEKLRNIGVRAFLDLVEPQAKSGLQIFFGIELGTPDQIIEYLSHIRLRFWAQSKPVPKKYQSPVGFSNVTGLADYAWSSLPGPHWLSIELPNRQPLIFSVSILAHRLTMLVFHQEQSGQINFYEYLPSLIPEEPADPDFGMARFPVLRRLESIQRSLINARLEQAYENAWKLLMAKWVEPTAGCLGGYILIKLGKVNELAIPANNMVNYFHELSDSYVLKAKYEESLGNEQNAITAFMAAMDHGLPIMRDGLEMLVEGINNYHLQHPSASLIQKAYKRIARGFIWTGFSLNKLETGRLLQF